MSYSLVQRWQAANWTGFEWRLAINIINASCHGRDCLKIRKEKWKSKDIEKILEASPKTLHQIGICLLPRGKFVRKAWGGGVCRGIDGGLLTVSGRMSKNYANESLPGNADELAERIDINGQFV